MAFDQYKSMLQGPDGKISGPRTVIAGFGAGVTESLLAVTPFESIKTTLYVHHSHFQRCAELISSESTTAKAPIPVCGVSFMPSLSLPVNAAFEASSKDLFRPLLGKLPTAQHDSDPTLF